jgi:WD40 repeat protein
MGTFGRPFLSRDGTLLGALGQDGLHLWKENMPEEVAILEVAFDPDDALTPGAASDDGGRVALLAGREHRVRVWDTTHFREVGGPLAFEGAMATLSLSPDGRTILLGGASGIVRLRDVDTGRVEQELFADAGVLWASAFSPDGQRFATGGADGALRIWDRQSGAQVAALPGSQGLISGLAFSADGETIAAASLDGATRLYTIAPTRLLETACQRLDIYPEAHDASSVCTAYRSRPRPKVDGK